MKIRRGGFCSSTDYFTEFIDAGNPLSESGKWLNGLADGLDWKDFQAIGGIACAGGTSSTSPPPFNDSVAQLKSSFLSLPANHYIEGKVLKAAGYAPSGTHELGLFVRLTVTAHSITGYESYMNQAGNHEVVEWNGALNDFTPIASGNIHTPSVPVDGDIVRLEARDSTISFYQNGILCSQVTNPDFATGQTGLQSYMDSTGTNASYGYYWIRTGLLL